MKYLIAAILATIVFALCVYGLILTGHSAFVAPAVMAALVMCLAGKESVDAFDKEIKTNV